MVYGAQWVPSVHLAQVLCCAAMIQLVFYLAKEVIIAAGRVNRSNLLQLGVQGSRIVGLLAVIPFGLSGASWGLFAAAIFGAAFAQWILMRTIGLKVMDVVKACLPSAYIAAVSTLPVAIWAAVDGVLEENYIYFFFGGGADSNLVAHRSTSVYACNAMVRDYRRY